MVVYGIRYMVYGIWYTAPTISNISKIQGENFLQSPELKRYGGIWYTVYGIRYQLSLIYQKYGGKFSVSSRVKKIRDGTCARYLSFRHTQNT